MVPIHWPHRNYTIDQLRAYALGVSHLTAEQCELEEARIEGRIYIRRIR